jgi:hypothetical protein
MENMVPPNMHPGLHPDPPDDPTTLRLPIRYFNRPWFRIYRCRHDPLYYGKTNDNRFNAPTGEFGVMYFGNDAYCAFIETFGQSTGINVVTTKDLIERCICTIRSLRPLALVDLTGAGLAQLGCDERLCAGEHSIAQQWSLAFWSHSDQPDGIYYRARHDPSRFSVALYDRASAVVHVTRSANLLAAHNKRRLAKLLNTYKFGLIDS